MRRNSDSTWAICEPSRSEEHTSELQSRFDLVCRLLLEKKKKNNTRQKTSVRYVCRSYSRARRTTHTSNKRAVLSPPHASHQSARRDNCTNYVKQHVW